jgi:hypothetical protein
MGKYMIIKRNDYKFMKDTINRLMTINYDYLETIKQSKSEILSRIGNLHHSNDIVLDKLQTTESARRKNASKIGGLTTSLNKERNKTKELLNTVNELEDTIELQKLESEKKDTQIKILKNVGKQKQMDDYKKLEELNKDIQKHKKVR